MILQYLNKPKGVFMLYNPIIMELSKKNKRYREFNEPLLTKLNLLAEKQRSEEEKAGVLKLNGFPLQSTKTIQRSERLMSCGTFLKLNINEGVAEIKSGNFCRDKFCALCQKIKSVKRYSQMLTVLNHLRKEGLIYSKNSHIIIGMVTVTQRNVPLEELEEELKAISTATKRMTQSKQWKDSILGYAKNLEITFNSKARTYHPHIHFLVVWDKDKSLTSADIQRLWKRSLRLQYFPQCDIEEAYSCEVREAFGSSADLSNIISECMKYSIKTAKKNEKPLYDELSVSEFAEFIRILKGKRFISYSGILAETRLLLKIQDEDTDKNMNFVLDTGIELPTQAHEIILQWSESEQKYKEYNPYPEI